MKLNQNPVRRVFLVSPPGCDRSKIAEEVAKEFEWKFISVGAALQAEGEKSTPQGQQILKCNGKCQYVDDELVIDIVKKEIAEAEKSN